MAQYKNMYWTSSTGSIFRLIRTPLVLEWLSQSVRSGMRDYVSQWKED